MPDTLAADIRASIAWTFQESLDLGIVSDASRLEYARQTGDGTGADQADVLWHDKRSLASGANDDLDLRGGLANTLFGTPVSYNFVKVKAILLVNLSTTAGEELILDSSVANAFTGPFNGSATSKIEIGPDSALLLANKKDGWATTAGTADVLRVRNPASAAPIDYKIVILGTTA